jgi:Putative regulator of cell autolysis
MFQKTEPPIIQLGKKTAFFSALSLNLFYGFIQIIVLIYSFSMGENVGGIIDEKLSDSTFYIGQVISLVVNVFLLYIFFRIEFWILQYFSNSRRRLLLSFFALLLFVGVLSTIISQLLGIWFKGELTAYRYSIIHFIKDLMLFITSIFVTYLIYLIIKNQERIEENKNLTIENFKNRYNALKNQTDPHFLFNSLNSLNGLIGYDDERAHEYVNQLASVFRYTMQEDLVVRLYDELEFTESYIYLVKIRYGDALTVHINIEDISMYQKYYILPFALQTLIENAVKHNIISLNKPLALTIKATQNESIIVENNLQPKQDVTYGNGMGLANLDERYLLMFKKNIIIRADSSVFSVEIPLIKNSGKYKHKLNAETYPDNSKL